MGDPGGAIRFPEVLRNGSLNPETCGPARQSGRGRLVVLVIIGGLMDHGIAATQPGDRAAAERLLTWHQASRDQGRSVISALVGGPEAAAALFEGWLARDGRSCIRLETAEEAEVVSAFLDHVQRRERLGDRAIELAAAILAEDAARLGARFHALGGAELAALLRAMEGRWPAGLEPLGRYLLADQNSESEAHEPAASADLFAAAARLVPRALLPGLLVSAPAGLLERATETLLALAERAPGVPIALSLSRRAFDRDVARPPSLRWRSALREGRVTLPLDPGDRAELDPGDRAEKGGSGGAAGVEALRSRAAALLADARRGKECTEEARSAAERLLFCRLEAEAETAGLFEQNGTLEVRFGPAPAEIDLLCRRHALALEVDGYHHFRDPERFRRDRRKDVLMQKQGFFVLRCLADDVVERLEEVVASVLDALRFCRAREPRR